MNKVRTLKLSTLLVLLLTGIFLMFLLNGGSTVGRYLFGVKTGVTLEGVPMERQMESEVRQRVERMAQAFDIAPQNARYDRGTGTVVAERIGRKLDVMATVDAVMNAETDEEVKLAIIRLHPEITGDLFHSINERIASFSTSGGGSAGRTDNLYMAAKYMNGMILAPGDVFSFNKATGPRTFERGYSMAPVVGGMGIGGGVCQVATTIYNTALEAGMEIIERHPHSIQVGYVRPGRDATVTDYVDFKFRNSTDKYIQIRSGAGGGHVWVQIWSQ